MTECVCTVTENSVWRTASLGKRWFVSFLLLPDIAVKVVSPALSRGSGTSSVR